MLFIFMILNC